MANKLELATYSHDPYVKAANGGNYMVKKFSDDIFDFDSGSVARYQHNSIRINPQSGLSNIFNGSAQQVDFLIDRNQSRVCHFDKIDMFLTIQNTGANAATNVGSHFMIDFIETLVDGAQVEVIYNHMLLYNEIYLAPDDETVFNNRSQRYFAGGIQGAAYGGGANLPAGTSRSFYIEIPTLISKCEIFMPALTSAITFRVHFQPSPLTSTSLATTISLTNADLHISGREYNDVTKNKLMARYRQLDHVCGFYQPIRAQIANQTISSATKTPVKLTEFSGYLSSQIAVFLVPTGSVQQGLYDFRQITQLALKRNGYTVSTFEDPPSAWLLQQMAELFGTTAVSSQFLYVISQSNMPVESADLGVQRGGVFFTPNDSLEIIAAATAAYDVYTICYRFCNVTVTRDGKLNVQYISA